MDSYAFPEVLFVASEWVAFRKELSVLVKGRILATILQPNENQSLDAHWAWHLPMCTPATE